MAYRQATGLRNRRADAITAEVDSGTGPGYVEIRTGTQPAAGGAATGTLLATLTLSDPSFGAAANGAIAVNAVAEDTAADASGTAGWFRVYTSAGAAVFDGAIPADMTLSPSASIVAGGIVDIATLTVTEPTG